MQLLADFSVYNFKNVFTSLPRGKILDPTFDIRFKHALQGAWVTQTDRYLNKQANVR